MNARTDNSMGAELALVSYIDAMLDTGPERTLTESGDADFEAGAGIAFDSEKDWQVFDFGRLRGALPADRIVSPGFCLDGTEVRHRADEPAWLHHALLGARRVAVVDLRRLILPDSRRILTGNEIGSLRLLEIAGCDIALVVESSVAEHGITGEGIHRCGANRRRKWLAGTQVEDSCVFLDVDGLVELIDSLAATGTAL